MVNLNDRLSMPSQRHMTDSGALIVPCRISRTGTQKYLAKELGLTDLDPNEIVEVHRTEEEVFDTDSVNSMRSLPVTVLHPKEFVTPDNASEYQVGMIEGLPVKDEETLAGTLVINNAKGLDAIEEGTEELSLGYTCDIVLKDGEYHQSNIRGNHLAIVPKGRAGSVCRISDAALELSDEEVNEEEVIVEAKVSDEAMMLLMQSVLSEKTKVADAKAELENTVKELVEKQEALSLEVTDAKEKHVTDSETIAYLEEEVKQAKSITDAEIMERCAVISKAEVIIGDVDKTLSALEIKSQVVSKRYPEIPLEDQSPEFIDGLFASVKEVNTDLAEAYAASLKFSDESPVLSKVEEARQNYINSRSK